MSQAPMSLHVCPDARWRGLAILQQGITPPSYFFNIREWDGSDVRHYVQHQLKPYYLTSLVFAGMALLTLLMFLTWRLVLCCCTSACCRHNCCCQCVPPKRIQPGPLSQPAAYAHKPRILWPLKILILIFALAAMGLTIWGMTVVKKDLVQRGWAAVDQADVYIRGLVNRTEALANNISLTVPYLETLRGYTDRAREAVTGVSFLPRFAQQPALRAIDGVANTLEGVTRDVNGLSQSIHKAAADVQTQVVGKIDQARYDYYDPSALGGRVYYYVTIVVLGVGLGILLLTAVFGFFNKRCLLSTFLFLTCIWTLLYFLGAFMAVLLVGSANDGCPAMEPVVLYNVGPKWKPMATYYLTPDSGGLTLVKALNDSQLVDIAAVDAQLNLVLVTVNTTQAALGGSIPAADEVLGGLYNAVQGVQGAKLDLLKFADVSRAQPVYISVKGYACCVVADQVGNLYVALTSAGWVMMVMSWIAFGLLGQLDKADRQLHSGAPPYDTHGVAAYPSGPPPTPVKSGVGDVEAGKLPGAPTAYAPPQQGATVWTSNPPPQQYPAAAAPITG